MKVLLAIKGRRGNVIFRYSSGKVALPVKHKKPPEPGKLYVVEPIVQKDRYDIVDFWEYKGIRTYIRYKCGHIELLEEKPPSPYGFRSELFNKETGYVEYVEYKDYLCPKCRRELEERAGDILKNAKIIDDSKFPIKAEYNGETIEITLRGFRYRDNFISADTEKFVKDTQAYRDYVILKAGKISELSRKLRGAVETIDKAVEKVSNAPKIYIPFMEAYGYTGWARRTTEFLKKYYRRCKDYYKIEDIYFDEDSGYSYEYLAYNYSHYPENFWEAVRIAEKIVKSPKVIKVYVNRDPKVSDAFERAVKAGKARTTFPLDQGLYLRKAQ
ncbi:hypothetical protein [Pyrococcus kukulkanii]|uniref:Uncharacterized protein n=1 Tax=Pyrococcus kukulkanii TaxID=1609559 RepID=A0ABV4T991_9EURY